MSDKIALLIDAKLHNEIVLRLRKADDVTYIIENVIGDFLERTSNDDGIWSAEYIHELGARASDDLLARYGNLKRGYHWKTVFLPNSTKLRVTYKGRDYFAEVRHEKIFQGDIERTPSEWNSAVANFTARNAWRDIYVQMPNQTDWISAEFLRSKAKEKG